MSGSLYFDVMISNELKATVEIRELPSDENTYLYEIASAHPDRLVRGTCTWTGDDPLDLIRTVLADYVNRPTAHQKLGII